METGNLRSKCQWDFFFWALLCWFILGFSSIHIQGCRERCEEWRGYRREEEVKEREREEKRQKIEHTLVSVFRTQVSNQGSTFQLHLTVLPPWGLISSLGWIKFSPQHMLVGWLSHLHCFHSLFGWHLLKNGVQFPSSRDEQTAVETEVDIVEVCVCVSEGVFDRFLYVLAGRSVNTS